MDITLLIIASLFIIIGIIGCVMPALPGPPLSYIGLLLLHFTQYGSISNNVLIVLAVLSVIVIILDYVIPVWGTKKFGGSKYGQWGATVGLVLGMFLGPFGIILGPFIGAFLGETIAGNDTDSALKSAIGSFLGFLMGIGIKLIASVIITYYFIKQLWVYFVG